MPRPHPSRISTAMPVDRMMSAEGDSSEVLLPGGVGSLTRSSLPWRGMVWRGVVWSVRVMGDGMCVCASAFPQCRTPTGFPPMQDPHRLFPDAGPPPRPSPDLNPTPPLS